MSAQLHSPTQVTTPRRTRCEHGYYVDHKQQKTPPCPACNPLAYSLDKEQASFALALLAMRNARPRNDTGRFTSTGANRPGEYRCWCCRESFELNEQNFRRDRSRSTGFQSRCKHCDNAVKTHKRRGEFRPGAMLLLAAGAL